MALQELPAYAEHLPVSEFLTRQKAKPVDPEWCSVFLATTTEVSDTEELLTLLDTHETIPSWATHVAIFFRSY